MNTKTKVEWLREEWFELGPEAMKVSPRLLEQWQRSFAGIAGVAKAAIIDTGEEIRLPLLVVEGMWQAVLALAQGANEELERIQVSAREGR